MIARIAGLVSKLYALLTRFECFPILLARAALGIGFTLTGHGKLFKTHSDVVSFFTGLGIPMPAFNAWFVGGVEFFGGMLLVVGLATRPIAFMLSFTMLIATLTTTLPKEGFLGSLLTTEVLAMLMLLWLVFSGPGAVSLDRLIARKFAPSKPPA